MEKRYVLVCVTGQRSCERLIAVGARHARELGVALMVLHVARTGARIMDYPGEAEALEYLYRKASEYGGDMTVVRADDVLDAIVLQARRVNAALIVTGRAAGYAGHDLLDDLAARLPDVPLKILRTNEGREG